ncbi:hypothetical protein DW322_10105 [Rhodococcus rhodnii]|uniref:C4-dicarboxylate ABC transporter n=1 Tax=Rhodococcus rhodnii TaxID=38312 RepID=A0A6P2CFK9_9NOCA|nr:hypothetical protein DW322_10105 [Rhodococcus rhodnii]
METMSPKWFAAVMGTAIVAVGAGGSGAERAVAAGAAAGAATLLVALTGALAYRCAADPRGIAAELRDPATFAFVGTVAMGTTAVSAALHATGLGGAWVADALWCAGTMLGVVTWSVALIRQSIAQRTCDSPAALLAVVPPMVSAATGGAMAQGLAPGTLRDAASVVCAGFAIAAAAGVATVGRGVLGRLLSDGLPAPIARPALWIPLGVVGQSIAAVSHLAPRGVAAGFTIVAGTVAAGAVASLAAITVATAYRGLPYSAAWWSFTFPLGTCAVGAHAAATATGWSWLHVVGTGVWIALCAAWATVAAATVRAVLATTVRAGAAAVRPARSGHRGARRAGLDRTAGLDPCRRSAADGYGMDTLRFEIAGSLAAAPTDTADDVHRLRLGDLVDTSDELTERDRRHAGDPDLAVLVGLPNVDDRGP